jgi:hypothetical protein
LLLDAENATELTERGEFRFFRTLPAPDLLVLPHREVKGEFVVEVTVETAATKQCDETG